LCYDQELLDKAIVIQTDANRLKQILYQLFDNGVKYTTKGEVGVSYKKEQDVLVFSVSDTGIGITPQQVNHIFNRFQKADDTDTNPYRGGGLGLAISKSLVEMLGGKIWVESNPGVGSTFFFSLPG